MTDELAALGGVPAITIDQARYSQWPIYTEEEAQVAADLIRNHALSSAIDGPGPITELENLVAGTWGIRHAIAHSSGTTALRTALFGVGVVPGDEVITQSAVHPVQLPAHHRLRGRACLRRHRPAHHDPRPCRRGIARSPRAQKPSWSSTGKAFPRTWTRSWTSRADTDLKVVEDNAVSQGTTHRGRMLGAIGDASAISFQDGKLTSAGEGGVFMTDSDEVFQRAATLGHYERLKNLPDPKWRAVSGFSFGEKVPHGDHHRGNRRRPDEALAQAPGRPTR